MAWAEPIEILVERAPRLDHLGLGHDVEFTPLVEQQVHVAQRFEAPAEAALGAADPLGHRPHLAVAGREEDQDPVSLTELVGPQHDASVTV